MICPERNTYELYLTLVRRLFAATARLRPVDACSVGMHWQRWAIREALWGAPKCRACPGRIDHPWEAATNE